MKRVAFCEEEFLERGGDIILELINCEMARDRYG
jgi:hypothetical protein